MRVRLETVKPTWSRANRCGRVRGSEEHSDNEFGGTEMASARLSVGVKKKKSTAFY